METKTAEKSYGYQLLKRLPQGTTLYTILRRVSRSGLTRFIDVRIIENNTPIAIVVFELEDCAKTAEQAWHKWGAEYKVVGCGMDMGFDLVYRLGYLVHQDGYYFNHKWL